MKFTKMHGLGNDFVVLDQLDGRADPDPGFLRRLADRRTGVGCDQVLVIEPGGGDADFSYRIFNADGSTAGQCGNGVRCIASWLVRHGHHPGPALTLGSPGGLVQTRLVDDGAVMVDMGPPRFEPADIPFLAEQRAPRYELQLDGVPQTVGAVSMGNPHLVLQVTDVSRAPVESLGARLENHARFPDRANVGFMQVIDRGRIRLRVFERGAGETRACGTGACAAVVIGRTWGLLDDTVAVDLPGGRLVISWAGSDEDSVMMTGPAVEVFSGELGGSA